MEEAKWYVAHTFSGYENKVATDLNNKVENLNLTDMIQDIVIPTETVVEVRRFKKYLKKSKKPQRYQFFVT